MISEIRGNLSKVKNSIGIVRKFCGIISGKKDFSAGEEINDDLLIIVMEIYRNIYLLKQYSSIITNFHFSAVNDIRGMEYENFTDYFIHAKTGILHLEHHSADFRTDPDKIREHISRIVYRLNAWDKLRIFKFSIHHQTCVDAATTDFAGIMLYCLREAMRSIQKALGDNVWIKRGNIPDAVKLLAEYAEVFMEIEDESIDTLRKVRSFINDLKDENTVESDMDIYARA